MGLKVIIPLKTNSSRVKNKNLRPFYGGLSLFDVKARQLLEAFDPVDVYVSSENPAVAAEAAKYGFNFCRRDPSLTGAQTIETDLVESLVAAVPDKEADIMWCQVTQPLFGDFAGLLAAYRGLAPEYDGVVVAKKFSHHLIDERGNPVNFSFGYWHKITQDLPKLYQVAWAAFIMKRATLDKTHYQIGRRPYIYETSLPLVDIDTEEDFRLAQAVYAAFVGKTAE